MNVCGEVQEFESIRDLCAFARIPSHPPRPGFRAYVRAGEAIRTPRTVFPAIRLIFYVISNVVVIVLAVLFMAQLRNKPGARLKNNENVKKNG